jgi:hypothetical protein
VIELFNDFDNNINHIVKHKLSAIPEDGFHFLLFTILKKCSLL